MLDRYFPWTVIALGFGLAAIVWVFLAWLPVSIAGAIVFIAIGAGGALFMQEVFQGPNRKR